MSAHTVPHNAHAEVMTHPRVALLGLTRAAILEHIQQHGAATVQDLADILGISLVAVRRHLELLHNDQLIVTQRASAKGRGRPATLYQLSDTAIALFPQRYDAFADDVLNYLAHRGGNDSVREFLSWRRERDVASLREAVTAKTLHERLEQLAQALSHAGFSASIVQEEAGFALVQNHCAIAGIARDYPEVCSYEASAFAEVLGDDVDLARRSTLAHGASHCVCSVTPRQADPLSMKRTTDTEEAES
ncbi:MAG: helix-turn-helix domain-containing protein [Nitriliruptoraceae bacterium]